MSDRDAPDALRLIRDPSALVGRPSRCRPGAVDQRARAHSIRARSGGHRRHDGCAGPDQLRQRQVLRDLGLRPRRTARAGSPDPQLRVSPPRRSSATSGRRSRAAGAGEVNSATVRRDGHFYWVDTTIVPFLDDRGKPWQYMAIRYDITERKRHEQRLREQATLASLGEMAAVVAHEVRNPLAGIRGGVQLLASYLPPSRPRPTSSSREIVARIDSLNAAITDLLEFARLREPKLAPVDLPVLLSDVVKSLRYDPALAGRLRGTLAAPCPARRARRRRSAAARSSRTWR